MHPFSSPRTSYRILVADDDAVTRAATVGLLAQLGYAAEVATDGEEVLEALVQTGYDIIFMDCQMPRLDGYGATQRIRQCEYGRKQPVIIALTTLLTEMNRRRCLRAGMDDYLGKPAQAGEMAKCLERWAPRRYGSGNGKSEEESRRQRLVDETKLMRLFLSDAPSRLEAMHAALGARDATAIERAAHTLKGSSGVVGAMDLAQRCEVLETLGEFGLFEQARQELKRCEAEFQAVRRSLEERIAQIETSL